MDDIVVGSVTAGEYDSMKHYSKDMEDFTFGNIFGGLV